MTNFLYPLDTQELQKHLNKYDELIMHNGIGFDIPVLLRLTDVDFSKHKITDTLLMSRLSNPSLEGGHSLKAWGDRLKFPKGDHNDWTKLSDEMVTYCIQDLNVTDTLYEHLVKKLEPFTGESLELEHKVQEIVCRQMSNGWQLDQRKAFSLLAILKERKMKLEELVHETFKPLPNFIKEITPKTKKNGEMSIVGLKFLGDGWTNVGGVLSQIDFPDFNLGSRQQIARYLRRFGWTPQDFTEKGHAIVDEAILSKVEGIPEASLIAEYLTVQKRMAQVDSWVEAVDTDGRVHGTVNTIGAVTGRMTHSSPNMAQIPASYSPYGKECRDCWSVPKGYKLVGIDASGLELRMLSHYMDDQEYTNEVINGDVHTANQKAAGLTTRDDAKTFIYAFLYGAGDAKIGSIIGGSKSDGARLKEKFLSNTPSLELLRGRVERACGRGHLRGLDGRKLIIRSNHAAVNTLLQSAGAIIMKKALTELDHYATIRKLEYKFIGNIHDEFQVEVLESQAEVFGRLAVECIKAAGIHFNMRCPLDGEYKVGDTWAQTH